MNNRKTRRVEIPLTVLAAAVFAAFSTAAAAEGDEVTELTKPESTVRAGVGYVDRDNQRFGLYSGLNEKGAYGLFDIDLVRRDDNTGTWLRLTGRDLGLDSREMRVEHNRQGDWGYFLDYSQIPRFNPFTVNTGLSGIGSSNVTVSGQPKRDVQLKTERDRLTLGFDKWLQGGFSFNVSFRNEEKDGARMFGRGTPSTMEFLAEPINQTTRQLEATLNYTGQRLQLSGGYYGTMFDNHNPALNIAGGSSVAIQDFNPIALPPDNQSHQLFLTGGYTFTPTTRGTFKLAYARQTQDDTFIVPASVGRTDLGGRVDTGSMQLGTTARPIPKLSLLANYRYENRDDKTPVLDYFPVTVTTTATGENEPRSIKTTVGKVEASYQLPADFRLTAGIDDEIKKRNTSSVRVVSFRDETDETSYRLELRRSMSETVTGAVAYITSNRTGSDFQTTTMTTGAVGSNLIAPLHLADRDRDKVRTTINWNPTEPLTLQFMVDNAHDEYSGRTSQDLGPRSGKAQFYSIDASYTFSEAWQATGWFSHNDNRIDQATCVSASNSGVCPATAANPVWEAKLRNRGDAVGLGLRGKVTSKVEVGTDVQYMTLEDEFGQQPITPTSATIASLPDIRTKLTTVKLYTRYTLQKNSAVRFDYVYDRFRTNDWTWSNFTYSDGTTVSQQPKQIVHFIGVSYYYRWQ